MPAIVTVAVPLFVIVAPPPAVTATLPWVTVSVVVSAGLSTSVTDTPAIGSGVSSAVVCATGTVVTGASFTGLMTSDAVSVTVE